MARPRTTAADRLEQEPGLGLRLGGREGEVRVPAERAELAGVGEVDDQEDEQRGHAEAGGGEGEGP